jgi:hypothetical protein
MKRFRLSTLMLLVVIAALSIAFVVQGRRAARREAELQARLSFAELTLAKLAAMDRAKDTDARNVTSNTNGPSKDSGDGR